MWRADGHDWVWVGIQCEWVWPRALTWLLTLCPGHTIPLLSPFLAVSPCHPGKFEMGWNVKNMQIFMTFPYEQRIGHVYFVSIPFNPLQIRLCECWHHVWPCFRHIAVAHELHTSCFLPIKLIQAWFWPRQSCSCHITNGKFQTIAARYESIKGAPDLKSLSVYNIFAALHILEISLLNMWLYISTSLSTFRLIRTL